MRLRRTTKTRATHERLRSDWLVPLAATIVYLAMLAVALYLLTLGETR